MKFFVAFLCLALVCIAQANPMPQSNSDLAQSNGADITLVSTEPATTETTTKAGDSTPAPTEPTTQQVQTSSAPTQHTTVDPAIRKLQEDLSKMKKSLRDTVNYVQEVAHDRSPVVKSALDLDILGLFG